MNASDWNVNVPALLRKHRARPRQRLGQNFLQDPAALQLIVNSAGIRKSDTVLEIGSGLGSLTGYLAKAARDVVAVEIDPQLAEIAEDVLRPFGNVRLVRADFLDLELGDLGLPAEFVVAANIPYYVTSAIVRRLLEAPLRPRCIVLTVQKEVAQRICAEPPQMSLLAVSVQIFGEPEIVAGIPAGAFYPVPDVDSAIVRIDCSRPPLVDEGLRPRFFQVVRAGFSQPRKMLRNALAAGMDMLPAQVETFLLGVDIDPRRRAETLTVPEWIRLAEHA